MAIHTDIFRISVVGQFHAKHRQSMEIKNIVTVLLVTLILVSCTSATKTVLTETPLPSQTSTPIPLTLTPKNSIKWMIIATPLNAPSSNHEQIVSILDQLHPYICIKNGYDLLILTPPPIEMHVPSLKFTEITGLPDPKPGYINERADNIDKSRTAITGCQPGDCSKLYIVDNKIGKIYEVNVGATTDRPLDWLQWINKNTVTVTQQGHLWINMVAINVEEQQFEYYGMSTGCRLTPTP